MPLSAQELEALVGGTGKPVAELLALLEARIQVLLTEDPDRLLQALYRLDLPEPAVHAALGAVQPAATLAQAVVIRVQATLAARTQSHSTKPPPDDPLAW